MTVTCYAADDVVAEEARMDQPASVAALVAGARGGDQAHWDALVDRFLPLVTATIARFRLTPADADDVNQTVWLRLVEHLDQLREPQALPGWLATTAKRESLRVLGVRRRSTPADPQGLVLGSLEDADPVEIDEALVLDERAHALREALLELPQQRRQLLELFLLDPPLSYEEISRRLDIPIGSIGPTRARALLQLRNTEALRAWAPSSAADAEGGHDARVSR